MLMQAEGELCVCELVAAMEESQPKISRHLAQLRNCGLLQDNRRGQWVYYALHPDLPDWASAVLNASTDADPARLKQLRSNLKAMPDRPVCC
ncbi:metalloregulator ArsR/SmtB family transcription factor [Microbulbifer celer]|uniref:Metalloregulator ArsR/SmtB family transcription factor n=2 Tax=Microbulbifer TaxID=48073 RepID=A0ABW3U6J9_9GAMM|nr:metalloregulator ArsR/SmtB family transcription factor [Microbulbifer celer]